MTTDKEGRPIFVAGREYRPKAFINPVWPVGQASRCISTKDFTYEDERGISHTVPNGRGIFTNGNDTREWVAGRMFEDVKE